MEKATLGIYILKKKTAAKLLPSVSSSDNKATRGRSLILAGSSQYPGAGILAAKAAQRMGSGYVMLAQKNLPAALLENPDFLLCDLNKKSWEKLSWDALLVGPGFGVNTDTEKIIRDLLKTEKDRVILDADALTVCAQKGIFPLRPSWIVTPHAGELSRCLGIPVEEINADRLGAVKKAQALFGCVVLLKGHGTLIANSRRVYQISSGNAALAKAGTGDVLAGVITALRAQGLSATKSALLGAYLHGATANLWVARKQDMLSMTASDVLDYLPQVIYRLRVLIEKSSQGAL